MLSTSLLPQEEKRIIKLEEASRLTRFFALLLMASFFIGIILLLPSYLPFILQRSELEETLKSQAGFPRGADPGSIDEQSRHVKTIISFLQDSLHTAPRGFDIFQEFLGNKKAGVEIKTLTVKRGGNVSLSGTAQTRPDLLDFENNLRRSNRFQELISPLSNIIREANINFTIQGKLKPLYSL